MRPLSTFYRHSCPQRAQMGQLSRGYLCVLCAGVGSNLPLEAEPGSRLNELKQRVFSRPLSTFYRLSCRGMTRITMPDASRIDVLGRVVVVGRVTLLLL